MFVRHLLLPIRSLALAATAILGIWSAGAAATRSALLPVPQGAERILTSGLFKARDGDVVVKYATSQHGKFVTRYFDLTRSRSILDSQAAPLGDDPRALGGLENSQGLIRINVVAPAQAGGGTAASVDLSVGHCAWPYASVIRFSIHGSTVESAAIGRSPAGSPPFRMAETCQDGRASTASVALTPLYQELVPILVADPSGNGYLAYFLNLPVVVAFSPDGKADLPLSAGLRIVPGAIISESYNAAFAQGSSPSDILAATDQRLTAAFAHPAE